MREAVRSKRSPTARGKRADPRVEQNQKGVLKAAAALLQERGYRGFTIESVIERSGISRSTIYRYWPNRTELIRDVVGDYPEALPMPATGALRTDLIEFLTSRSRNLRQYTIVANLKMLPGLAEASKKDALLLDVSRQRAVAAVAQVRQIFELGRGRGEINRKYDLDVLSNTIVGSIIFQTTFLSKRLREEYIVQLVDTVLGGVSG